MGNEVKVRATVDDDVSKGLASARAKIEAFAKDVGDGGIKVGTKAGEGIKNGLAEVLPKALAPFGPELLGIAVATAPLIGAAISGGIIGGVGAGGVVGAFMVAKNDARVSSAIDSMKSELQTKLQTASVPFINTALDGIDQISTALDTVDFDQLFGDAANNGDALFGGISSAIEDLGDAFESLSAESGPVMESIGEGIAVVAEAAATGLESLSDNAEGGASALQVLFAVVGSGISNFFMWLNVLTEIYQTLDKVGLAVTPLAKWLLGIGGATEEITPQQQELIDKFRQLTEGTYDYADGLKAAEDAVRDVISANRALYGSDTDVAEAMVEATEKIKENGKTLSLHSEKGRENRKTLEDLAGTLQKNYENFVKVNGEGEAAVAKGERLRDSFIKTAVGAGLSADAAQRLADKILGIPARKETKIEAKTERAIEDVARLQARLKGIKDETVRLTIITNERRIRYVEDRLSRGASQYAHGGITGAASGGNRSGLTWVGEQGPELAQLPPGTTVNTAGDSQRMMKQAYQGTGGSSEVMLSAKPGSSRDLMDLLIENLQYECRTSYNGSAQEMIGVAS